MIPPITQSIRREKIDFTPSTWNPRLVNTPVPTMLAITMAVAVTTPIFNIEEFDFILMLLKRCKVTKKNARQQS